VRRLFIHLFAVAFISVNTDDAWLLISTDGNI